MPLETGDDYYNYYSSMMPWGNQGTGTTNQGTGITQLATPTIKYPPQGGGGGGGFNNIYGYDPNVSKTFTKDVWTEQGGPANMYGGWNTQDVIGYQSPSGWKTEQGKNINHLGLEVPTMIGTLMNKWMGTKVGEPQVGDIKGTFTEGIPEEGIWAALTGKKKQQKVDDQLIMNQEIENRRIRQEAAERQAAAAAAAAQVRQNIATYGSGDRPSTGMNVAGGGKGQSPTGGDVEGTPFSRGGILGAF